MITWTRTRGTAAVIASVLGAPLLAGCGSPGTGQASPPSTGPRYSGPAMPGVEAKPFWSQPFGKIVAAVAVGDSFAVITGGQTGDDGNPTPATLSVIQDSSGKTLRTIPLHLSSSAPTAPTLSTDVLDGTPVAVARFDASYQASGLHGNTDHDADIVVDASGKQLYTSPADHEQHLVGGYRVTGQQRTSVGLVDGIGPQDGVFTQVTSIADHTGGSVADFGQNPLDTLYTVSGTTAVVYSEDQAFNQQVRGLDLSRHAQQVWAADAAESYLTAFDGKVLTETSNDAQSTVTVRDIATGRMLGTSLAKQFDCHLSTYDQGSHLALCASVRMAGTPLTAVDLTTGKILWQKPTTRAVAMGPAAHGFVYLPASDGNQSATQYVVLAEKNGSVAANNIATAPIAITGNGTALTEIGDTIFGCHLSH